MEAVMSRFNSNNGPPNGGSGPGFYVRVTRGTAPDQDIVATTVVIITKAIINMVKVVIITKAISRMVRVVTITKAANSRAKVITTAKVISSVSNSSSNPDIRAIQRS